jgi:hypothetical protein
LWKFMILQTECYRCLAHRSEAHTTSTGGSVVTFFRKKLSIPFWHVTQTGEKVGSFLIEWLTSPAWDPVHACLEVFFRTNIVTDNDVTYTHLSKLTRYYLLLEMEQSSIGCPIQI